MRSRRIPPRRRALPAAAPYFATLGVLLCLAGCQGKEARRSPKVPIVVATVEKRAIPYEIEATGTVEPIQSAGVTANVGGLVTSLGFREGDEVGAGQVLFRIDPRPFQAVADRAEAVLDRDRAQAKSALLDLERSQELAARDLLPESELEKKRADAEALQATVRADSATLASALLDLAYATVRAPVSGRTGALSVHVGDMIKAGETASPLVTINQLRPIRVRFTVPQADLAELRQRRSAGTRVLVATGGDNTSWLEGRLVFVDNTVEAASGTLLLKAEFANQGAALWPGEFVRVRLRLAEQQDAVVVPAVAVTNSQQGPYCYVVKPDTTVEARPVTVQRTWGDWAVIASGVTPGETVVTDGQLRLGPGARATIRTASPSGAAGGAGAAAAAAGGGAR